LWYLASSALHGMPAKPVIQCQGVKNWFTVHHCLISALTILIYSFYLYINHSKYEATKILHCELSTVYFVSELKQLSQSS
jgi:hypothetical protein